MITGNYSHKNKSGGCLVSPCRLCGRHMLHQQIVLTCWIQEIQDTARQTLSVGLPTYHSVAWAYVLLWILCMQVKYSRLFTIYGWIIKSAWHAVTFIRLHMIWLHMYTLTICSKIRLFKAKDQVSKIYTLNDKMLTKLQERICKRIYTVLVCTTDFNSKSDKMAHIMERLMGYLGFFYSGQQRSKTSL